MTLLHLNFKDKQVESYNVFPSLKDIKCLFQNRRFYLDNVDQHLAHVESFFVSDSVFSDLIDPPNDGAQTPALISSDHN